MISYDLAKKLKDAGFPQHTIWCWSVPRPDLAQTNETEAALKEQKPARYATSVEWGPFYESIADPDLSELIAACGFDFGELALHVADSTKGWAATTGPDGGPDGEEVRRFGKTPEEAVAKLWLALNAPNPTPPAKPQ